MKQGTISAETASTLKKMGHDAYSVSGYARSLFGRGQIILNRDGVLWGGSDPRADGCAFGV